jgi:hypothetical protein
MQAQEANETNIENLIDSDTKKNSKKIRCLRCDSFILQENSGLFKSVEEPVLLPSMRSKRDLSNANDAKEKSSASEGGDSQIQNDKLKRFWCVNDMLTFENVGFTNSVNNIKYLICADCEIGPIGLQYLDNPNEFLVSIDRVKHV